MKFSDPEKLEAVGTLTKCKCGREFYLSFAQGFECATCSKKSFSKIAKRLNEFFKTKEFRDMQAEYRKARASKQKNKKTNREPKRD